ncbi:MAG: hypothetical protein J6T52_11400 [Bacteroidaceae bacterium]|nr:hypothetical protein [Bacteroidaceae bacterium]
MAFNLIDPSGATNLPQLRNQPASAQQTCSQRISICPCCTLTKLALHPHKPTPCLLKPCAEPSENLRCINGKLPLHHHTISDSIKSH